MRALARFLRSYARPDASPVRVLEIQYERPGGSVPASLYTPARSRAARLPAWVVLHGLTYTGREHPGLVRLARSLAGTGRIVLVPDIPEWRALRVAPAVAVPSIRAAVQTLHDRPDVDPAHVGLMGFSFGATQGLVAAADAEVGRLLRGVVAWGGYHELRPLFHFGLTGEFEHAGTVHRLPPDPYGCWVMAANYLTSVDGHEHDADVAAAVRTLALECGRRRDYAWEPAYDELKLQLRAGLPVGKRAVFDRLAPLTTVTRQVSDEEVRLARGLADAAGRVDPLLVPGPHLPLVNVPTLLAHGRDDRLVPFTESVALARALPPAVLRGLAITALFAHSGGTQHGLGMLGTMREGVRFVDVLRRMLRLVG